MAAEKYQGEERRKRRLLDEGVSVADVVSIAASIITAIGIGGPLLVWGGKMDARMANVEREVVKQAATDAKQDAERESQRSEFRTELRSINEKLDRLIEKAAGR